jgi:hypothetical protein
MPRGQVHDTQCDLMDDTINNATIYNGVDSFLIKWQCGCVPLICHHLSIAMDSGKCYDKLWHFVVHTMVSQRIRFVPGVFGGHALRMMRAVDH